MHQLTLIYNFSMKQFSNLFFALLIAIVAIPSISFAQVSDTTYISADANGKLYRTSVTVDPVTGKKTTIDDPITDTVEQLNIYRQAYTQEIVRRMADYKVVSGYKAQIGQVIKNATAIEDQFKTYMLDTTGWTSLAGKTFGLKNHPTQSQISFRVTQTQVGANGKITTLGRLQWSFTKAAGTWKRVHYAPGYIRLVGFEGEGNMEFFLNSDLKIPAYLTLGEDYRINLETAARK